LAFDDKTYQKAQSEARARPEVKVATEVYGIGKGEYLKQVTEREEDFKQH